MPTAAAETGSQIPLSAVLKEEVDHAALAVAADDNEVSVVFHAICVECDDKKLLDSVSGASGLVGWPRSWAVWGREDYTTQRPSWSNDHIHPSFGDVVITRAKPTDVRPGYTGYCEQHDSLIDVLSVREMLEYTAELKCSQYLSHNTKVQRVDELLNEMGLTHRVLASVSYLLR